MRNEELESKLFLGAQTAVKNIANKAKREKIYPMAIIEDERWYDIIPRKPTNSEDGKYLVRDGKWYKAREPVI